MHKTGLHFLVVEDDEKFASRIEADIKTIFGDAIVTTQPSLASFRKFMSQSSGPAIDIAIVDLYFGSVKDGFAVVKSIQSHEKFCPIIVVSSTEDGDNDRLLANACGVQEFLLKASENFTSELMSAIEELLSCQVRRDRFVNIIHISDLHFTKTIDYLNLVSILEMDLKSVTPHTWIGSADIIICSGDLTDGATEEQFASSELFLSELGKRLRLPRDRIVIVPGNHDVDWSVDCYDWMANSKPVPTDGSNFVVPQPLGNLVQDPKRYPGRFSNFAKVAKNFPKVNFESSEQSQGWVCDYPDLDIQFLCVNSAWYLDEYVSSKYYRTQPETSTIDHVRVPELALTLGLSQLSSDRSFGFLVVHHPIRGHGKLCSDAFVGRLYDSGIRAVFHGDTHNLTRDDLCGELSGRKMHVIGCGTLSFDKRPKDSYPLYHVLTLDKRERELTIWTRFQKEKGGTFQPFSNWIDTPLSAKSSYSIKIEK
jgi:response regulator of citrate/malate metabolism